MAEPIYTEAFEELYYSLPEFYRNYDARDDWPMKRWLSAYGDQVGEIAALLDRLYFDTEDDGGDPGETSDLGNPQTADVEWLPWLAQILGVKVPLSFNEAQTRELLSNPVVAYQSGTQRAMNEVIRAAYGGYVSFLTHTTDVSNPGEAGEWDLCIVVGTDFVGDVIEIIKEADAKPAGVLLYSRVYSPTWAEIHTAYPTWADINDKTWEEIQTTGL